jgi:hypothetical protein
MSEALRRSGERAAYWQSHLERCAEQGLSVAAYARVNGVSAWPLYQWRARLRPDPERSKAPLFRSVRVVDVGVSESAGCRVTFPNGVTVACGPLDPASLAALLRQVSAL